MFSFRLTIINRALPAICMNPPKIFCSGIAQFLKSYKYALCSRAFSNVFPLIVILYKGVLYGKTRLMSSEYILPEKSYRYLTRIKKKN